MPKEALDELYKSLLHYFRPSPFIGAAPPSFWSRPMYFYHTPLGSLFRVRIDGEKSFRQGFIAPPMGARISPVFPINTAPRALFRLGFCLVKKNSAFASLRHRHECRLDLLYYALAESHL